MFDKIAAVKEWAKRIKEYYDFARAPFVFVRAEWQESDVKSQMWSAVRLAISVGLFVTGLVTVTLGVLTATVDTMIALPVSVLVGFINEKNAARRQGKEGERSENNSPDHRGSAATFGLSGIMRSSPSNVSNSSNVSDGNRQTTPSPRRSFEGHQTYFSPDKVERAALELQSKFIASSSPRVKA